jgi:hypothetical protein
MAGLLWRSVARNTGVLDGQLELERSRGLEGLEVSEVSPIGGPSPDPTRRPRRLRDLLAAPSNTRSALPHDRLDLGGANPSFSSVCRHDHFEASTRSTAPSSPPPGATCDGPAMDGGESRAMRGEMSHTVGPAADPTTPPLAAIPRRASSVSSAAPGRYPALRGTSVPASHSERAGDERGRGVRQVHDHPCCPCAIPA